MAAARVQLEAENAPSATGAEELNATEPVGEPDPLVLVTVAVHVVGEKTVTGDGEHDTAVVVPATGGAVTTRLPPPSAKSEAEVEALTVKGVVAAGVPDDVSNVRVVVFELSLEVKESEVGLKLAVTPVGSVDVMLMAATNEPDEPPPEPRLTVTVYVAELPLTTEAGD